MPNHITNIVYFTGDPTNITDMLEAIKDDDEGYGSIDFNKIIPMPETLNIDSGSLDRTGVDVYLSIINPDTEDMGIEKVDKTRFKELLDLIKKHERSFYAYTPNPNMSYEDVIKQHQDYDNHRSTFEKDLTEANLFLYGKMILENLEKYGATEWYDWSRKNWGTKWNAYQPSLMSPESILFQTAWSAPHPIMQRLSEMYPTIKIRHEWADEDCGNNCGFAEYLNGNGEITYKDGETDAWAFAANVLGFDLEDEWYISKSGYGYFIQDMPEEIPAETIKDWETKGVTLHGFKKKIKYDEELEVYDVDIDEFNINDFRKLLKRLDNHNIDLNEFMYG